MAVAPIVLPSFLMHQSYLWTVRVRTASGWAVQSGEIIQRCSRSRFDTGTFRTGVEHAFESGCDAG